jgi:hypothetical protein
VAQDDLARDGLVPDGTWAQYLLRYNRQLEGEESWMPNLHGHSVPQGCDIAQYFPYYEPVRTQHNIRDLRLSAVTMGIAVITDVTSGSLETI